jgi:hypothetical protein
VIRKILAVVLGVVAAVVLIVVGETFGHSVYPAPPDLDVDDVEALRAYVTGAPIGASLLVMGAWLVATLGGGLLACFISRETPLIYSAIVGGLVLVGTIINLMSIPHPLWFSITSVLGILAVIFVTGRLGLSFVASPVTD